MQDDSMPKKEDPKIPPKLDLRKNGILKSDSNEQGGQPPEEKEADQITSSQPPQSDTLKIKLPKTKIAQPSSDQQDSQPELSGQQKPSAEAQEEKKETSASEDKDSPTIRIKGAELKPKPGAPVKLKSNAQEDQSAEVPQDQSEKAVMGIPSGQGEDSAKKETSKIPLDQAKVASEANRTQGNRPKTIKISPGAKKPAAQAPVAGEQKEAPQSGQTSQDEKRKTSRISLESALGMDQSPRMSGGPKTIKLKRPGAGSGKVSGGPTIKKVGMETQEEDEISKTAELKEEPSGEEATPTRRKTIKVKRPGQKKTVRKAAQPARQGAAQPQASSPAPGGGQVQVAAPAAQKEPGVFFSLTGIAAILVILVTIYVMAAQAFGPNKVSLSQISYGMPGLDLTWPGQIQ